MLTVETSYDFLLGSTQSNFLVSLFLVLRRNAVGGVTSTGSGDGRGGVTAGDCTIGLVAFPILGTSQDSFTLGRGGSAHTGCIFFKNFRFLNVTQPTQLDPSIRTVY